MFMSSEQSKLSSAPLNELKTFLLITGGATIASFLTLSLEDQIQNNPFRHILYNFCFVCQHIRLCDYSSVATYELPPLTLSCSPNRHWDHCVSGSDQQIMC